MPKTILKPEKIDVSKVTIGQVSSFKMGQTECKKIMIEYKGEPLYIMGGKQFVPFGLGQFPKPEDCNARTRVKYTLNMTFKGEKDGFENHETVGKMYSMFRNLDMHLVEVLLMHSGEFLSEETTNVDIIDNLYQRLIQSPKNADYDSFLKLKMPTDWKNPKMFKNIDMYNANNSQNKLKLDVDGVREYLRERKWVRPVIKFDCIYYINGKLYPSLEAEMLKIYDPTEEDKQAMEEARKKREEYNNNNGKKGGKFKKNMNKKSDEFI